MNTYLGIELGSTRIKAVAIDDNHQPVYSGDYTWAADFKDGIWTYDLNEAWLGLKTALKSVGNCAKVRAMGISAMMHGYLAFDKDWNLLVPFRTWPRPIDLFRLHNIHLHVLLCRNTTILLLLPPQGPFLYPIF